MRGAGFPVNMLDKLAAPDAVRAIDSYLDAKPHTKEARQSALSTRDRLLRESDGVARRTLKRVGRQILKDRVPDPLSDVPEMKPLLDALGRARDELTAARGEAERYIAEALACISNAFREVGRDARFREAIVWQNRKVLHESVDVLLRTPAATMNAQTRRHEQLRHPLPPALLRQERNHWFLRPRRLGRVDGLTDLL